jgi:hypothetical protein
MLVVKINPSRDVEFFRLMTPLFMGQFDTAEQFSNRYILSIPRETIKSLALVFEKLEKGTFLTWLLQQFLYLK